MQHSNRFVSLCILIFAFSVWQCSHRAHLTQDSNKPEFKVLGYLHSPYDWQAGLNAIDLNLITDLNLAFINPDSTGVFQPDPVYHEIIRKAHEKNVKVYLSFGGGSAPDYLEHLMHPDKNHLFVDGLLSMMVTYGFDGIDVDLENALINQLYPPFVSALARAVKQKGKLLTAALASWNAHLIPDSTLAQYDFINVMSYDKTGPWNLSRPGQHSPFIMAESDFNYFNQGRSVPAEKIMIGLPFYGYGFGNGAPQSMTYKNIVQTYPGSERSDSVTLTAGGKIYYNGIPTISQKVQFATKSGARGIMIWQLLGDTRDERSLLKTINSLKK